MTKARAIVFTLNNYEDEDVLALQEYKCKYIVFGHEIAPTTGTPHLQGYIAYSNPRHLSAIQKEFGWHVEVAKGTATQNYEYCSKDQDFFEKGERPSDAASAGAGEAERWKRARLSAEAGDFDAVPDDIFVRYPRNLTYIRELAVAKTQLADSIGPNYWYWGPTNTGKSRRAREDPGPIYIKSNNKWWDHYNNQPCVIIDDFDRRSGDYVQAMKVWADRYPFMAEVKGGSRMIRPERIIVTSNYHPKDIWTDPRDLEPIMRRFNVIEMN